MKFIERFTLKLISIIIIIISTFTIFMIFGIVSTEIVTEGIDRILYSDISLKVTTIVSIILFLLSIRCLFAKLKLVDEAKNGIMLENASGKLIISKESLENLISSVSKNIPGAESISSKTILDKDKNLRVYVTTVVSGDVMLKEISTELQKRIKEAMKRTADLEVKEVNIKIKNITNKKSKTKAEENTNKIVEESEETKEEVNKEIDNGEE